MRRILFVLGLISLSVTLVIAAHRQVPFESDIERFEVQDRVQPPAPGGVVFVGSSSIVRWTTLAEDFPGYNVINRGFGGSQISDSIRFAKRIVTPYKPSMVVFFAGTNDIASGKSAQTVFEDFQQFVSVVRSDSATVPIVYISITPAPSRWKQLDAVKTANRLIKDYCRHHPNLRFVDLFRYYLTPQGGPRPELFVADQLHMNPDGYKFWKKAIGPLLPLSAKTTAPSTPGGSRVEACRSGQISVAWSGAPA